MNDNKSHSERDQFDRRSFLRGAAVLLPTVSGGLSLLLAGCGGSEPTAQSTGVSRSRKPINQTFTTPFGFIPSFIDAFVAKQEGFWKHRGLDITIHGGQGTSTGLQTVISGSAQYGRAGGASTTTDIITKDLPLKAVLQCEQGNQWRIASLPQNPINDPKQLQGKRLGVVSPGGETATLVDIMLAKAGVPKSAVDMPVVGVGPGAYQLAKSGKIAAWVALDQDVYTFKQEGMAVHSISLSDYAEMPRECYVASTSALKHNHDAVVAFAGGLLDAFAFLKDPANFDRAYHDLKVYSPSTNKKKFKYDLEVLKKEWYAKGSDQVGELDSDQWDQGQRVLKKYGLVTKIVPIQRLIDTSIVQQAKGK
jgi:NitT/TauT family transport system substrate-binding protein